MRCGPALPPPMRTPLIVILVFAGVSLGLVPTCTGRAAVPRPDHAAAARPALRPHGRQQPTATATSTTSCASPTPSGTTGEGRLELRGDDRPDHQGRRRRSSASTTTPARFTDTHVGQLLLPRASTTTTTSTTGAATSSGRRPTYDAWVASGRHARRARATIGTKTTSCVMDEEFITTLPNTPYPALYPSSGLPARTRQGCMIQGLSPGWGDTYDYYRFEQWIDLGQANAGRRRLRAALGHGPAEQDLREPEQGRRHARGPVDNEAITHVHASRRQDRGLRQRPPARSRSTTSTRRRPVRRGHRQGARPRRRERRRPVPRSPTTARRGRRRRPTRAPARRP